MNEKLLPITAGTLDEDAIKKAINSSSVYGAYGTYGIADVRPTCMNDQVWMGICKPYLIPLGRKLLTREDIFKIVDTMIANAGYPDARNLRVLAGTTIMTLLSCIPEGVPDCIVCNGVTYVHDKWMKPREMRLQHSANELSSYISSGIENLRKTLKEAFGELFNLEENNMSRKSLEVKKVIYSGPCTIVIWADDSKTIVRCQDGDTYSKEVGLLMCLAKKVWGTNASGSNFNDYISKAISEKEENE
nr:MAG TPA: pepsin inhibitor [Caudoviricetes sp.]